ncbi:unnamed protein product [Orchesella dallaii]|uniref:KEN domain-containing protein n=1 Tax=Orchesella dallaii TaxID=48710 RepID=A0ABP1RBT3_9HEXA
MAGDVPSNFSRFSRLHEDSNSNLVSEFSKLQIDSESKHTRLNVLLSHPIFWPAHDIVAYLKCVSDHLEDSWSNGSIDLIKLLQDNSRLIFGGSNWKDKFHWRSNVHRQFLQPNAYREKGYKGKCVKQLLRAIRNGSDHYQKQSKEVQQEFGELPHGYIGFWTSHFPLLLSKVYAFVQQTILMESSALTRFYVDDNPDGIRDDLSDLVQALAEETKKNIGTGQAVRGGLLRRYWTSTSASSPQLTFLKVPSDVLLTVLTQSSVFVKVHESFLTVSIFPEKQTDKIDLFKCSVTSRGSFTISFWNRDISEAKVMRMIPFLKTSQTIIFSTIERTKIDKIVQNTFGKIGNEMELESIPLKWTDLDASFQSVLLQRNVMFQGFQVKVSEIFKLISDNTEIFNEIFNNANEELIRDLVDDTVPVLLESTVASVPPYYIKRKLLPRKFIPVKTLKQNRNQILVIICDDNAQALQLINSKKYKVCSSTDVLSRLDLHEPCNIILDDESHFSSILSKTQLPLHLLKFHTSYFEWIKSEHCENDIQWIQRLNSNCKLLLSKSEDQFLSELPANNQPIIISDSPGMGKSILLESIANKLIEACPSRVVKIYSVNKFVIDIKAKVAKNLEDSENHFETALRDEIIQILCDDEIGAVSSFWKCLLKFLLTADEIQGIAIELMLDGLDEVVPSNFKLATKILKLICNEFKSVRLWVSTRVQHLHNLEREFCTMGYYISPFDKNDQMNCLMKIWSCESHNFVTQNDQTPLKKFARSCLENTPENYGDIIGVPLLCKLYASVYQADAEVLMESGTEPVTPVKITSILDLYERVVEKKLHIYIRKQYVDVAQMSSEQLRETTIAKSVGKDMAKIHMKLALNLLMPPKSVEFFNSTYFWEDDTNIHKVLEYGILECKKPREKQEQSTPFTFIHRTFAEYYVALFIVELLNTKKCPPNLLVNVCNIFMEQILQVRMEDYKLYSRLGSYLPMEEFMEIFPKFSNQFGVWMSNQMFVHGPVIIKFLDSLLEKRSHEVALPSQALSEFGRSLQKPKNWIENLAVILFALIDMGKLSIIKIVFDSLKYEDKIGEFVQESNQTHKLGEIICSAVSSQSIDLLIHICEMVESEGLLITQVNYFILDEFVPEKPKIKSPLQPLRVALSCPLNFKVIEYLVAEKGFQYSTLGALHRVIQNIACMPSHEKNKVGLQEKLEVIKFFVEQDKNILEELSPYPEGEIDYPEWIPRNMLFTPLLIAGLHCASVQVIKCLINLGANVNAVDESVEGRSLFRKTILHYVASRSSKVAIPNDEIRSYEEAEFHEIVECAFTHGFNPTLGDANNNTFLHIAVAHYRLIPETWDLCQRYNFDFTILNDLGQSVLELAVRKGVVWGHFKFLLEKGCDLENKKTGENILHWAANAGHFVALNFFMEHFEFSVNSKCLKGRSPLHSALCWSVFERDSRFIAYRMQTVLNLIHKGADVNACGNDGIPPFMIMFHVEYGLPDVRILGILKAENAIITPEMYNEAIVRLFKNFQTRLAFQLDRPMYSNAMLSTLKFLKNGGGDVHCRLEDNKTLLHVACEKWWIPAAKWLVEECSLDENAQDASGRTPVQSMRQVFKMMPIPLRTLPTFMADDLNEFLKFLSRRSQNKEADQTSLDSL